MRPLVLTLVVVAGCGAKPTPVNSAPASVTTPVVDPAAVADLDDGERRIEVAGGDCAAACEGLNKMVRARIKLCSPRTTACEDGERREGDARRKVAAFCEPCPAP